MFHIHKMRLLTLSLQRGRFLSQGTDGNTAYLIRKSNTLKSLHAHRKFLPQPSSTSYQQGQHCSITLMLLFATLLSMVTKLTDAQSLWQGVFSQPVTLRQLYAQDMATVTVAPEDATCGMRGVEQICSLVDSRICENCGLTPPISHSPDFILDRSNASYWQSSSWKTYPSPFIVNITISLRGKEYVLQGDVVMRFRVSPPEAMVLEKSRDGGKTWTAYQYFSSDCLADFNMEETSVNSIAKNFLDASCVNPHHFENIPGTGSGEIKFDLSSKIDALVGTGAAEMESFYRELDRRESLWEFLTLTDMRLVLVRPARHVIGEVNDEGRKLHYGIYSIDADLSCDCNLHGNYCELRSSTSEVVCNCLHHTEGRNCERCQAGYQAFPWQPGSFLPFPMGTANECRESPTQPPEPSINSSQPLSTATDTMTTVVTDSGTDPVTDTADETLDPRPCTPDPCQGNGDCILEKSAAGYRCSCHVGFAGYACEINTDPCRSNPCSEVDMVCVSDRHNHFRCVSWAEINGTQPPATTTYISPDTWLTGPTLGIIIGTCLVVPLFILFIFLLVWYTTWHKLHADDSKKYSFKYAEEAANKYSNQKYKMGSAKSWLVPDGRSSMRAHKLRDRWIIHESQLELGKLIYSGEFSYICEGIYKSKEKDVAEKVVVKLLRDEKDEDSLNELKTEFEVLACMGRHPNVVWLQGMCTRVLEESTQMCLVNQYVARGDMLRILRRGRSRRKDQPPYSPTPMDELMSFACDIAQGMRHITLLRYVHRNLCAKNVLITFNNKAKIADFGMAMELPGSTEYVRYTEHRNKHIKRWMAYEALLEDMYSIKSDVWSFGIVLWEIVTLGGMPYHNIKSSDLAIELKDHTRMEYPRHCSPEIYDLMLRCWHRRPESRPSFDMLCTELKKMKQMAKKHLNLKDYTYQLYVPVKLEEDVMDTVQDATFV